MGEEQYFQKLNITEKSENSTHLFISYNISQTDDPTSFNSHIGIVDESWSNILEQNYGKGVAAPESKPAPPQGAKT